MDDRKKPELYVLQLKHPENIAELDKQVKHIVEHFYTASEGRIAVAFAVKWLLGTDGALHELAHILAERWGEPILRIAKHIVATVGLAARCCEMDFARNSGHCDAEGLPDREWVKENTKAFSWTLLCGRQDELGLKCGCALCSAAYIANKFEPQEGKRSNLGQLFEDIKRVANEERDPDQCLGTELDRLAKELKWQKPITKWGREWI